MNHIDGCAGTVEFPVPRLLSQAAARAVPGGRSSSASCPRPPRELSQAAARALPLVPGRRASSASSVLPVGSLCVWPAPPAPRT
jgi:hypothetical protein